MHQCITRLCNLIIISNQYRYHCYRSHQTCQHSEISRRVIPTWDKVVEAEAKARNAKSRGRDGILGEGAASLLPTSLRVDDLSLCWPLKKASPTNKKCESLNGSSTIL